MSLKEEFKLKSILDAKCECGHTIKCHAIATNEDHDGEIGMCGYVDCDCSIFKEAKCTKTKKRSRFTSLLWKS